jgi:hypothetical protein
LWLTRPPVEEGAVTNDVALVCESEAALSDRVIEALDGVEAAVGERFVDEPPEMFGRLVHLPARVTGPWTLLAASRCPTG